MESNYMNTINKLLFIFSHKQKVNFLILVIIILIGSGFELLGIAAIMPLVKIVTDPSIIHSDSMYSYIYALLKLSDDRQFILLFVIALVFIYVFKNVYLIFMYSCQYRYATNNQKRISMRLMKCYMNQPYVFHLSKNVSELQRNMRDDTGMLFTAVLSFVQFFSEIVTCVTIAVYLIIIDKTISISVILLLSIFALFFFKLTKKKSEKLGMISRDAAVTMNIWIRQSFEGIKEIIVSNKEQYYICNVDRAYSKSLAAGRRQNIIGSSTRPLFEAVCISSILLVVGVKIFRGVNLQYFIPVLSAFAIASFRLLPSFSRLASNINSITYNKSAIDNVYKDLKEEKELKENIKRIYNTKNDFIKFDDKIDIRNITFAYPNTNKPILMNADLSIRRNKSVAIIGASGAGKTTLADIILGLLEPQEGQVLVDGMNIYNNLYQWHNFLGYIPQSIYLIDDTIRNNILFGIPDEEADEVKIWKVIDNAQLGDFVRELPDGINTVVGEHGVRLSGGQRQRIGIARALYNDPVILVLDEATSALDNETESAVMEAIDSLRGSRTMIIIAHRLTTIRNCDEIYEVKNGKIIRKENTEVFY